MRKRIIIVVIIAGALIYVGVLYTMKDTRRAPRVDSQGAAIAGRVLNPEGRPEPGAVVYADNNGGSAGRRPSVLTDKRGNFLIKNLMPGTYTVSAEKVEEGYAPTDATFYSNKSLNLSQVTVEEGQTVSGVDVHLGPKAAKLTGRIVDAVNGQPLLESNISLRRVDNPNSLIVTGPNEDGTFELLVPTDPFTVTFQAPGYKSQKQSEAIQLTSVATKKLNVALRRAQ